MCYAEPGGAQGAAAATEHRCMMMNLIRLTVKRAALLCALLFCLCCLTSCTAAGELIQGLIQLPFTILRSVGNLLY